MADGFDLFGLDTAPTFDTGSFSLFGDSAPDLGASLGQPSFGAPQFDLYSPGSTGFQDWQNSLGTGLGTYGTGFQPSNAFMDTLGPMAPGRAPGEAGGGFDWGGALKTGAGTLGSVLGLGVSGLGMANAVRAMQQGGQQQKIMNRAQEQMQQVAQPAAQAGANLTRAGEQAMLGGPLPGQMESMVQKWRAESRARIQNYLAKTGISDSTMAQQFESWIDQQEGLYRQNLAQSLLQGGYSGVSTAMGPASGLANTSASQMGGTDQFLKEANNSLALLTGAQRA